MSKAIVSPIRSLADHAGYVAAKAKEEELNNEYGETNQRAANVSNQLSAPVDPIGEEADRLLAGELATGKIGDGDLRSELARLHHRLNVLHVALEKQRRIVDSQREEASREICKTLHPAWSKDVKRIGVLARELADLGEKQWRFFQDMERQGIFVCEPISTAVTTTDSLRWQLNVLADAADSL